jgi:hypothetical protein
MSEVPEIEIKEHPGDQTKPDTFTAECPAFGCGWFDFDSCRDDVESAANIHIRWHEDGMPE